MELNIEYIEKSILMRQMKYKKNFPLSSASTFRIGGNALFAVYPQTFNELTEFIDFCRDNKIYYNVIGNGSNVLFSDDGFNGIIIFTSDLNKIHYNDEYIFAECGVPLTFLSCFAEKNSLGGIEFVYGIPGTFGGAIYMNAGAYGGEISDVIENVNFYDLNKKEIRKISKEDCNFSYRDSIFQHNDYVILSATLNLNIRERDLIRNEMNEYMSRRIAKQPLEFPSGGSTFKRYPGYFTGKLIEDAGLKGYCIGDAQVSEKHAGFIINRGHATAKDITSLISYIKGKIYEIYGIKIECEIKYIPYSND